VIPAPANENQDDPFFRKSFLKTRVVIGVIGVLLPIVLVGGNLVVFGQPDLLPSLSDYYHSDMRDWFVGSLWAIGSGLLVYLAARRNLADSVISFVGGLLAVGVALFPTNAPDTIPTIIAKLHVACAALLFALLGVICFRFGNRDGKREDRSARWRVTWRTVHRGCAIVIWLAVVASVALAAAGSDDNHSVFWGETIAVLAFGLSWFLKGSELFNILRVEHGRPPILREPAPNEPVAAKQAVAVDSPKVGS
jgi:Protein of unknown function (DUF998)